MPGRSHFWEGSLPFLTGGRDDGAGSFPSAPAFGARPRILWGVDPGRLSGELRFTGLQGIQGIPDETWVQILFAKCPPGPYNLR